METPLQRVANQQNLLAAWLYITRDGAAGNQTGQHRAPGPQTAFAKNIASTLASLSAALLNGTCGRSRSGPLPFRNPKGAPVGWASLPSKTRSWKEQRSAFWTRWWTPGFCPPASPTAADSESMTRSVP